MEASKRNGENNKPNVVFIISDDHRAETIGAFDNPSVATPVLDQLAKEGVSFRNTRIYGGLTGAVCAPSRACVNTGKAIFNAMIGKDPMNWDHSIVIEPDNELMPQKLKAEGYHTHMIGKWHNDKQSLARSFTSGDKIFLYGMSEHTEVPVQDFDPSGQYAQSREYIETQFSTELFTDSAVKFIDDYENEDPFYLYVAYTAPHDPRTPPDKYAAMYPVKNIKLPENYASEHPFDTGDMTVRDEGLASIPRNEQEIRQHIADYYGMITHLDEQIGRIIAKLKEKGIYENTIFVYTADHGIALGQHGLMGKQNMYDHSINIPFILRGPSIQQDKMEYALMSNIDIYPTIADLCRIPTAKVDGISMGPLIRGEEGAATRQVVCSAYRDVQRMVTDGRWKLIRYFYSPLTQTGTNKTQLFDLHNDPWETKDLSEDSQYAPVLEKLDQELIAWMHQYNDILQ